MKLTDLQPKWFTAPDGRRLGISFACPVHANAGINEDGQADCCLGRIYVYTEPIGHGTTWARSGEDFESMSLNPSISCSIAGSTHWHGFLKDGDVSVLQDSVGPAWPEGWIRG